MLKVPDECYREYGSDLDGCSTQEREGCGSCILAKQTSTRADRIRSMSDEDLAEWLEGLRCCGTCNRYHNKRYPINETLGWLQQPAEE